MKLTESTLRKIVKKLVKESLGNKITPKSLDTMLKSHYAWLNQDYENGKEANLSGFDLSGMNLQSKEFAALDAIETNFAGSDLSNAIFDQVVCKKANFTGAILSGAVFNDVDLRGAQFTTEFLAAEEVREITCDDEQLPYLIACAGFSRSHETDIF